MRRVTIGGKDMRGISASPPQREWRTYLYFALALPEEPSTLEVVAGSSDGKAPRGSAPNATIIFSVEVNCKTVASRNVLPYESLPIAVDLSLWAGKSVLLTLVTDAAGASALGWPIWIEPRIVANVDSEITQRN